MRVFYPVSTRLSELVNDDASMQSSRMMLWSMVFIGILSLFLPSIQNLGVDVSNNTNRFFAQQQSQALYSKTINSDLKNSKAVTPKSTNTARSQKKLVAYFQEKCVSNARTA